MTGMTGAGEQTCLLNGHTERVVPRCRAVTSASVVAAHLQPRQGLHSIESKLERRCRRVSYRGTCCHSPRLIAELICGSVPYYSLLQAMSGEEGRTYLTMRAKSRS